MIGAQTGERGVTVWAGAYELGPAESQKTRIAYWPIFPDLRLVNATVSLRDRTFIKVWCAESGYACLRDKMEQTAVRKRANISDVRHRWHLAYKTQIPPAVLEQATRSLTHRGPDDSGMVLLKETQPEPLDIGLGHRRLAILDLSPLGHQPMQDPVTGSWIVYNGEIYNFRDVRKELEQEGAGFVSQSDTEVLLKAYARWGEKCLTKFRGMFAFALWDARQHRLLLARDPMGIKPLYYAQAGSYFLFASEVRTLLGTGLVPRRVDHAGLINFLTFGSAYDPITLVEGVRSLPPGHTLTWESGTLRQASYWDLTREETSGEDPGVLFSGG
jgi:asparagine synthase (glutamine-hydrolysing)